MLEAYAYPSHVHALSFVSIKLSGNTNYREWQEQMMCLVDSHDMMGFIDGTLKESQDITNDFEKKAKYREWKRSDTLVKGWIFGSLSEGVMRNVVGLNTANEVWDNLKTTYSTPSTPDNIEMQEEWHYPSHVNVANFVSIKLEGETNFLEWKAQMTCLLKGHDMLGFVDGTLLDPTHKGDIMSDTVVKGWIFGSLSESVMGGVVGLDTSIEVWNELKTRYGPPDYHNMEDTTRYLPLYRAILSSNWEEVEEIVNNDKDAMTTKLDPDGFTPLHLAIHECKDIEFIESLLKQISPESLPTMLTHNNYNPLHIAAMVGNTEAAKLLVEKNPHSLFIPDEDYNLPIGVAVMNSYITTFQYLLEACKQHIGISQHENYARPFEGRGGVVLLALVIDAGLVDVACELINKYPDMAESYYGVHLVSIANNWDLYYSGTNYNFYQTFLYTHVRIEIDVNLDDTNNIIQDIENQDKCNRNSVTNRRRRFFYYVIQKIYAKFWNAVLLRVAHVKHLQEEKAKHEKALVLLKCICYKVCKSDEEINISEHYGKAFHLAVQNGTYEAVDQIMGYFPQAIWAKKNDYFATQIAIKDRCLEVHDVLLRYLGRDKYLVNMTHDRDDNNRLHLAAQLAPIPKLNLVSGAALQMQRELQWFKGVENFDMPQFKEALNKNGETPIMVFRREHMELRKDGESWMKKTADSYTITAALIITIVFAAAITVPGGNDNSGKANYATKPSFFIFIISDAISLFTSTTSLLLFLSILTARYLEDDFLYRLPLRLILGLGMLFVSVTSMMVAFSATLYLTFGHGRAWIMYPVAVLACLPIASFVTLQLPLLFELINSTYCNRAFSKHRFPKIK